MARGGRKGKRIRKGRNADSKSKKILTLVLTAAISLMIGFILLELMLRMFLPAPVSCRLYEADENVFFKNKADVNVSVNYIDYNVNYEINDEGLREDRGFYDNKNEKRVLTLGDSFVFGWGLNKESTFQEILEARLEKESGKDIEVINAGVSGWATQQAFVYLNKTIDRFEPDAVMYGFFNNDVKEDMTNNESVVRNNCLVKKNSYEAKQFLNLHVRSYAAIKNLLMQTKIFDALFYKVKHKVAYNYDVFEKEQSNEMRNGWVFSLLQIKKMNELCEAKGCRFILVYIPQRDQYDLKYRAGYLNANGLNEADFDFGYPNELLKRFCEKEGIVYVDLLERFNSQNITEQLYFEHDPHFNEAGAREWAEGVWEEVKVVIDGRET